MYPDAERFDAKMAVLSESVTVKTAPRKPTDPAAKESAKDAVTA